MQSTNAMPTEAAIPKVAKRIFFDRVMVSRYSSALRKIIQIALQEDADGEIYSLCSKIGTV